MVRSIPTSLFQVLFLTVNFQGSYAGFLTIHMKNTYPDVFFGALSSSSPILGQVSDPNDPYMYGIGNQASSILSQMSAKGALRIKQSFEDIRHRISQSKHESPIRYVNRIRANTVTFLRRHLQHERTIQPLYATPHRNRSLIHRRRLPICIHQSLRVQLATPQARLEKQSPTPPKQPCATSPPSLPPSPPQSPSVSA